VHVRPRALSGGEDDSPPQQELRQAVATEEKIDPRVFARSAQVASGLVRFNAADGGRLEWTAAADLGLGGHYIVSMTR
jgi:hypothetical protein